LGSFCFFVFLHSCIPSVFSPVSPTAWLHQTVPHFTANPAHAKRHGQGTHLFLLIKGDFVGRLEWDFSPAPFLIIRTYAEQVKGKMKKKSEF
jgi:hypothetical protein